MLRQIFILKGNVIIYKNVFGKGLNDESFQHIMNHQVKEFAAYTEEKIVHYDYFGYHLSFLINPTKSLIILTVTDLTDENRLIEKEIKKILKEFLMMFEFILGDTNLDIELFKVFDSTSDNMQKNIMAKISLVGFSGVGKTTITQLIQAKEIPTEHVPTITGDIGTIKIGKMFFHLWDFAGQEQFSFLWGNFMKGSDAVLLITDSTVENCDKSKYFVDLIEKEAPNAKSAIIANKQDLPGAIPVEDIERMLGMKAYAMVAIDPNNQFKMLGIIADILEINVDAIMGLQVVQERTKKVQEAEKYIQDGNFMMAQKVFDEVVHLCLQLKDEKMSEEFREKSKRVEKMMRESQNAPVPNIQLSKPTSASENSSPSQSNTLQVPNKPVESGLVTDATNVSVSADDKIHGLIKDLKIKRANLEKMEYDLEIQSMENKISADDYKNKVARLKLLKEKIENQIKELTG